MTLQLRTLAVLAEDTGSVPSAYTPMYKHP